MVFFKFQNPMQEDNIRYKQAKKITVIGAVANAFLGIIKVLGGIFFKSHGLLADGVHSFSDLFTDGMVLIASKYGSQEADDLHPYGHQRIETAATMVLALLLIMAGIGIAWDSIDIILNNKSQTPELISLPIVIISIATNEILYHATHRVGKIIGSPLIIANAWHHRSDAASSAIVLIGILGAIFGIPLLDPLAAVIIGGMIIKMGIDYGIESLKELVDTGVSSDKIQQMEATIKNIDGVEKMHQFRNRMMGKDLLVDVHIIVASNISVSEGHHIAQKVHKKLLDDFSEIRDVTIHVDPEDDEIASPSLGLPSRKELGELLINNWREAFPQIQQVIIHYIDGKILFDIFVDNDFEQLASLRKIVKKDVSSVQNISIINFYQKQDQIGSH